jgi:hypothetical protein
LEEIDNFFLKKNVKMKISATIPYNTTDEYLEVIRKEPKIEVKNNCLSFNLPKFIMIYIEKIIDKKSIEYALISVERNTSCGIRKTAIPKK